MRHFAAGVVAITLVIAVDGCGDSESARETSIKAATSTRLRPDGTIQLTDKERAALGLATATATEADLPDSSLRFGRVVSPPGDEAQVVAPVTGRIARPPSVMLGSTVRASAPIAEIVPTLDTPDRIAVGTQSAERLAEIPAAERELARAEADAARARDLSPQVVSSAKLQEAETAVEAARAHLEALRTAGVASDHAQMQPIAVTAPMAGVVSALNVPVGALVNKGDVLARVQASGPLWIDVSVPQDDPVGSAYLIEMPTGSVTARLLTRGRLTDADGTRHDRLVVDASDAARLSPGASVPVRVARGTSLGVVIAETALVPGVEGDVVFVETAPGVFASRRVRIAARLNGRVRVASGLVAGDHVVVQGAMALQGERLRSQLKNSE